MIRRPRFDGDDLDATLDEDGPRTDDHAPIGYALEDLPDDPTPPHGSVHSSGNLRRLATGSGDNPPVAGPVTDPYFDASPDNPASPNYVDAHLAEWQRAVTRRIAAVEAETREARRDAEHAREEAATAKRENAGARKLIRIGLKVMTVGLGLIGAVAVAVWQLGKSIGGDDATESAREARRLEVRAVVHDQRDRVNPELRSAIAENRARIEGLRGALDQINRGAVRVLGPQPQPLPP